MDLARALLGLAFFCFVAWLMSSHKRRFPWRVAGTGIAMQFLLGWAVMRTQTGRDVFEWAAAIARRLLETAKPGAQFVFGPLANSEMLGEAFGPGGSFILAFAGDGLVAILFFSALMSILYHLGVMQFFIWCLAKVLSKALRVSGAESMSMAANVFVGQTEAPLVVKPYLSGMTSSELNALMTGGFATIAGSVLAVYMGILPPELGPHLLTASVMSAPAAFVMAKIMLPETAVPETGDRVELRIERTAHNLVEAAANGTADGLKLWLNVIAMLIAFLALINFVDWPLAEVGTWFGMTEEDPLTLRRIFGWVFAPVAWMMGVEGWHDSQLFGSLLGTKIAANEFVAFLDLGAFADAASEGAHFAHEKSSAMAAFALCGFANFGSIGIQIGGISPLAENRRTDLAKLAVRAMLGGAFASWMTATVAGAFL